MADLLEAEQPILPEDARPRGRSREVNTVEPAPEPAEFAGDRGPFRPLALLLGQHAESPLVPLQGDQAPPDQVVNRRPRRPTAACDLGQRPVLSQVEVEDSALAVGQQAAVSIEQREALLSRVQSVKEHSLTA